MKNCPVCGAEMKERRKTCSAKCRSSLFRRKNKHGQVAQVIHYLFITGWRYDEFEGLRDDLVKIQIQIQGYIDLCNGRLEQKQAELRENRRQNRVRK